jgi:hypothetical protein
MKKFIINTALFILPIIIVAYPLDCLLNRYIKKSNLSAHKEYPVWNDILDGRVSSDIVIYGSSRSWVHIDPTMIQDSLHHSAYNLGIDGHNFLLQYLRHQLLLKYNKKPKLIIHSLDIFTLQKRADLYNSDQFLPYMLWNSQIDKVLTAFEGFKKSDYEIPLIRYYGKYDLMKEAVRVSIKPQSNVAQRIRGYQGQVLPWSDELDVAKRKMGKYKAVLNEPTLKLFEEFLKDCKAQNIKIVFVFTPEYIEGQKFVENRAEFMQIYKSFSRKYSIPFFDFSDSPLSYQKKYFYNSEHLTKEGSEIFTSQLIDTIKKYNFVPAE